MEVIKWDGVTDANLILKALLFFIDEEDEEKALKTSYGDFGKYLQKMYRGSGAGNGDVSIESFKGNPRITLKKKRHRLSAHLEQGSKAAAQIFA